MTELANAIATLKRYGPARDRRVDHEVRQVTITDDQALAVLQALSTLESIMNDDAILVADSTGDVAFTIPRTETGRVLRESDLARFVDDAEGAVGTPYLPFNWGEDTPIPEAIGQAFGRVSMCWLPTPTGVFQSTEAIATLDELLEFLQAKSVGF
jgi:hypothetical protein